MATVVTLVGRTIALATRKFPCVKYYIMQGGFLQQQIFEGGFYYADF